jgi:polyisoprenoid-binding protein YceI
MARIPSVLILIVAGCACAGSGAAAADDRDASAPGGAAYRIEPADSLVTVLVRSAGPLARFGHDHVVAGRDLGGHAIWPEDPLAARAELVLPIAALTIDEPELRAAAGLESEPSEKDIAGTRANLLASVEAADYPDISVRATLVTPPPAPVLGVEVDWHGVTRAFELPVELTVDGERLEVSGSFDVRQSEFGVRPFRIWGGMLSVEDRLEVSFRLSGRRVTVLPK